MVAILSCSLVFNFFHITDASRREKLSRLTKYLPRVLSRSLSCAAAISNRPRAAPRDVLPCPVNLQIQEEDSSFSHHRRRAPGDGGGSHNSGETLVLTRQNDRAEERPDSRADLPVHSLQTRADTHTHTDGQTDTETHTHTLLGRCMKIIERINLTWAEVSFRVFGLFHKAQHGGKIMRSSLGQFVYWCLGTEERWFLALKSIVYILKSII